MIRKIARYAVAVALIAGAFGPYRVQAELPDLPGAVYGSTAVCATEDSTGCAWPADRAGNGRGSSFYTAPDGRTYYVPAEVVAALVGA
jgi:hypothetical protein